MGDEKSGMVGVIRNTSRDRNQELLIPVAHSVDDDAFSKESKPFSSASSLHHGKSLQYGLRMGIINQRFGCLGSTFALIKKAAIYLPVLGWSMWFNGCIFLERSWSKDENTLKSGIQDLNNFPLPFWLALFVEGTRFTHAKLAAAQQYAASAGIPVPRNVLIPRTKGFVCAVTQLRSFVPAIYDITVAIPKNEHQPTMLRIFGGRSSVVHVHIERHLMEELPETCSGISQWCKDTFVSKDALLERHLAKDTFGSKECHDIGRPVKSLLVVLCWSCILIFGAVQFFEWCPFSWGEVAFCAVFLVLVAILMQILIVFSQSEQPSPVKESESPRSMLEERLLSI